MADIPDDLTDVGTHGGNQPPTETGQTVRSPEGPDPGRETATPSQALYQVVRNPSDGDLVVRSYPARATVSAPETGEEVGQYRTVDALRGALADENLEGGAAVFESTEGVHVASDISAEHPWIGQAEDQTVTFFDDPAEASSYAEQRGAE